MKPPQDLWELRPYEQEFGPKVIQWASAPKVALAWRSLANPPNDPSIFGRWHAEQGVRAYVLLLDQTLVAYGETWEEKESESLDIEVAGVIVAPALRGRGIGRTLVEHLLSTVKGPLPRTAFVRVRPDNAAAIRCYHHAGFHAVSPDERRAYNADQPTEYVWMSRPVSRFS
jgi:ribosomal protein S18 acetylase RimI-like enzyme